VKRKNGREVRSTTNKKKKKEETDESSVHAYGHGDRPTWKQYALSKPGGVGERKEDEPQATSGKKKTWGRRGRKSVNSHEPCRPLTYREKEGKGRKSRTPEEEGKSELCCILFLTRMNV